MVYFDIPHKVLYLADIIDEHNNLANLIVLLPDVGSIKLYLRDSRKLYAIPLDDTLELPLRLHNLQLVCNFSSLIC